MPKSKKQNNFGSESKTAWRTPVKLPTASAATEPMKSLYAPNDQATQENALREQTSSINLDFTRSEGAAQQSLQDAEFDLSQNANSSALAINADVEKPMAPPNSPSPKRSAPAVPEFNLTCFNETDFLKLLRTEKMDFYSLAEILRGSSMALYCVLYSESLAKGETRCQIRQNELMMRAGINNPATLYKQERWLTALKLINKSVRLGNHNGASYEVRPLKTLPLPPYILDQFGGYLADIVR